MTPEWVHPGLVLILGAWLIPLLKGKVKRVAMLAVPAAALLGVRGPRLRRALAAARAARPLRRRLPHAQGRHLTPLCGTGRLA